MAPEAPLTIVDPDEFPDYDEVDSATIHLEDVPDPDAEPEEDGH